MHVGIIQPPYPQATGQTVETTRAWLLDQLARLPSGLDLVVLPEYANCPGAVTAAQAHAHAKTATAFIGQIQEAARSLQCNIAVNIVRIDQKCLANVTVLIDRSGACIGEYRKTHLSPTEREWGMVAGDSTPCFDHEGIRYAFLTCFDIYFAEYAERIAAQRPDLVVFPTYQRGEDVSVILAQTRGRALDIEAYLLRASYAMGDNSVHGGHSLVAAPSGEVLLDAAQQTGVFTCEIDPRQKRLRPRAYGLAPTRSREIVEAMRRPALYRTTGPGTGMVPTFPCIVAHRGLSGLCPENTLPAFAAAIALGAPEIECDVWGSRDGELVICHDDDVARTSDGHGLIHDMRWDDIASLDAGRWFGEDWAGLRFPRLDDLFAQFAGRVIMNLHIKEPGDDGWILRRLAQLGEHYDVLPYLYIAGEYDVLEWAQQICPSIPRCCLEGQHDGSIVDHAITFACQRVQFWVPNFTIEDIARAHAAGIICNAFYADTPDDAAALFAAGMDAILTNYCTRIRPPTATCTSAPNLLQ